MASSRICEQMISAVNCAIDEAMDTSLGVHSRAHRELGEFPVGTRRPGIAFDEWNLWYRAPHCSDKDVEEVYNYSDALALASLLHVILRNAKTIELANVSLAVNTIAAMLTDRERIVRQTTWYPQRLIRDTHRGRVVETIVDAPVFSAKHERFFCGIVDVEKAKDETLPTLQHFDDIPALDAVASVDDTQRKLTISIVQKLADRPLAVHLDLHGLAPAGEQMTLHRLTGGDDLLAENTLDQPDRVGIETRSVPLATTLTLPSASLTVLEMELMS